MFMSSLVNIYSSTYCKVNLSRPHIFCEAWKWLYTDYTTYDGQKFCRSIKDKQFLTYEDKRKRRERKHREINIWTWNYAFPTRVAFFQSSHFRVRLTSGLSWGWILIVKMHSKFFGVMTMWHTHLQDYTFWYRWPLGVRFSRIFPRWGSNNEWRCWVARTNTGVFTIQTLHSLKQLLSLLTNCSVETL